MPNKSSNPQPTSAQKLGSVIKSARDIMRKDKGLNGDLDRKNPNSRQDFEHLPPEQLLDDILKKEARIAEILQEIKSVLEQKP